MNCKETEIIELVKHYLSIITGNYKEKKKALGFIYYTIVLNGKEEITQGNKKYSAFDR